MTLRCHVSVFSASMFRQRFSSVIWRSPWSETLWRRKQCVLSLGSRRKPREGTKREQRNEKRENRTWGDRYTKEGERLVRRCCFHVYFGYKRSTLTTWCLTCNASSTLVAIVCRARFRDSRSSSLESQAICTSDCTWIPVKWIVERSSNREWVDSCAIWNFIIAGTYKLSTVKPGYPQNLFQATHLRGIA